MTTSINWQKAVCIM